MNTVTVRPAGPGDKPAFLTLWQGYLDFYAHPLPPAVTDFTWTRLMDPASPLSARLAERRGQILGFAIHQHHPSTWVMGDDCYLEDMFVSAQARGQGVGRALIEDLVALARARGWKRLYWHAATDNTGARALYDRFTRDDGHVRYRLEL